MICTVEKTITKRICSCQVCGETMVKGEERYTYSTPTQKSRHAHIGCYYRMCDGYGIDHTINDNEPSKTVKPHTVEVIAYREEGGYFGQYKFEVKPYSPSHRVFKSIEYKNRHSSGHIVPMALAEGYKVLVNGTEVKTIEEFETLTNK